MKIGIDFHSAEQAESANCTCIRNLVNSLIDLDANNEYFLCIADSTYPYYRRFDNCKNVCLGPLAGKDAPRRLLSLGLKTYRDEIDILHVQYVAPPFFREKLVVFADFVAEELLPTLYAHAEVLIYPSFYEGIGLPVPEAIASGCLYKKAVQASA
jgi:glycosyltransferase involved in cell wall biosynthesis